MENNHKTNNKEVIAYIIGSLIRYPFVISPSYQLFQYGKGIIKILTIFA
jgi:hypothetical protein